MSTQVPLGCPTQKSVDRICPQPNPVDGNPRHETCTSNPANFLVTLETFHLGERFCLKVTSITRRLGNLRSAKIVVSGFPDSAETSVADSPPAG